jgi:hypothetical protein
VGQFVGSELLWLGIVKREQGDLIFPAAAQIGRINRKKNCRQPASDVRLRGAILPMGGIVFRPSDRRDPPECWQLQYLSRLRRSVSPWPVCGYPIHRSQTAGWAQPLPVKRPVECSSEICILTGNICDREAMICRIGPQVSRGNRGPREARGHCLRNRSKAKRGLANLCFKGAT